MGYIENGGQGTGIRGNIRTLQNQGTPGEKFIESLIAMRINHFHVLLQTVTERTTLLASCIYVTR
jgi:hypothetical protein